MYSKTPHEHRPHLHKAEALGEAAPKFEQTLSMSMRVKKIP